MSSVLSVRLSDEERALLEAASTQARTNVSDFVRRKALEAAEIDIFGAADRHDSRQELGEVRGLGGSAGARGRRAQGARPQTPTWRK